MRVIVLASACFSLITSQSLADPPKEETFRYVRPGPGRKMSFVPECRFQLKHDDGGWSISSTTGNGDRQLTVSARYDAKDILLEAKATLFLEDAKSVAEVTVKDGKATVQPKEKPAQVFDVPAGVIVTSAPDWSDIFLLCRRYDRKAGGTQTFTGLWIHPKQPAQLLKFTIERTGTETIKHAGKDVDVGRYRIQIRGPNPYVAWADASGMLIKLHALPTPDTGIIHEAWTSSWAGLRQDTK